MQTVTTFYELAVALDQRRSCVTIGVFDGVHLGHQALVKQAVAVASSSNQVPVALTFSNHPLAVLAPPYTPRRLLTPARKAQLLHDVGIDIVLMMEFTREFSSMSAERFIQDCLIQQAHVGTLVCGYDFSFGSQGSGNIPMLEEAGARSGFEVFSVPAVSHENLAVKSTHIRDLLSGGNVSAAATLLSRPHEVPGVVVSGMKRGRTIGFPTANLEVVENYQIPAGGVYLCAARAGTEPAFHPAMVNIGTSPTFGDNALTVEAHLLDFRGDIHGQPLSLFFIERLRDEQKFPSIDALVEQLNKDRQQSRSLWGSEPVQQIAARIPAPVDHQIL